MTWTTTLTTSVDERETAFSLLAVPAITRYRLLARIENETVWIIGSAPGFIFVERGALGSDPVPHAAGSTVSRSYPADAASGSVGPQGPAGPVGQAGPAGPTGNTGATGAQGPAGTGAVGATGAQGSAGSAGANGTSQRTGTGAPAAGLGIVGDVYIDSATGDLWLKS